MDIKFYNLDYYPIFIVAIIVGALLAYALFKRIKELNFYGALSKNKLYDFALRERILLYKSIIFFVGFLLLCIVILRPLWGDKKSEIFEKDRDIIFVLDISKSMLAQDVKPSRLEEAKDSIENALPYLFGAKVALVAFAGSSEIRCPLTDDYEFFSETLKNCIAESALIGGSFLNSALEKVVDKLIDENRANKQNVIIISDGGDFITKSIDNIAKEIKSLGVKLTIIGIGDPVYESKIPLKDGTYLSYKDEYVKTKLEDKFLKEVAFKSGGNYVEIGIKPLSVKDILSTIMSADTLKVAEDKSLDEYEDRYQVFLMCAIIAFLIWLYPIAYQKKKIFLKSLIFIFAMNLYGGQGEDLFRAKDYKNAELALIAEVENDPQNLKKLYNLAQCEYALDEYEKAYNSLEDILSILLETEDLSFQDKVTYDMAVVACMHAKSLANSDIKKAHSKAQKAMDLFRQLLKNASTNPRIPDAFLYHRKIAKTVKTALVKLEKRAEAQSEIKAEFIAEIEAQIDLQELSIANIAQDSFEDAKSSQSLLIEKTNAFLPKIETSILESEAEIHFTDVQEFAFLMNTVLKSITQAKKGEESCLLNIEKSDKVKAESYGTATLIDLNVALAMLKENAQNQSNPDGSEGETSDEEYDEEGEYEEDYDDDYSENYKDSENNQNDFNEGSEMMSLPNPEQLEGEILQSEKENNMRREQTRGKYQKVEKDW